MASLFNGYGAFIISAYGIGFGLLFALLAWIWISRNRALKEQAMLERLKTSQTNDQ